MILHLGNLKVSGMREAGRVAAMAMQAVREAVAVGVSTLDLDAIAEEVIRKAGAKPSFKGYRGFPATICASVNQCVVHGIPNTRKLRQGDLVSVDLGALLDGWQSDIADTFAVSEITPQAQMLMDTARECFFAGFKMLRAGNRIGDYGNAVYQVATSAGCGVVRALSGHGIGRNLHEDPEVPNFGKPGTGARLRPGMVLACEPMITAGDYNVTVLADGWSVVTIDGSLSAHYEHTVLITEGEPEILTQL